jgi:hypothetical protein
MHYDHVAKIYKSEDEALVDAFIHSVRLDPNGRALENGTHLMIEHYKGYQCIMTMWPRSRSPRTRPSLTRSSTR